MKQSRKTLTAVIAMIVLVLMVVPMLCMFTACNNDNNNPGDNPGNNPGDTPGNNPGGSKETIIIYTTLTLQEQMAAINSGLKAKFPNYNVQVMHKSLSEYTAEILEAGKNTVCDIVHETDYLNLVLMEQANLLADLSDFDQSAFTDDVVVSDKFICELRNGGGIIINTEVLKSLNLPEPKTYQDLLDPQYKQLISMPNPKSSGTGYMFLKMLANAWGEQEALDYFKELSKNMLSYTASGGDPVRALVNGDVAIAIGMLSSGALEITNGAPLKIIFLDQGAPFSLYGQGVIAKDNIRPCVWEVFHYLVEEFNITNQQFYPEQIYKGVVNEVPNFPVGFTYGDMSNNTSEVKAHLLDEWDKQNVEGIK